MKRKQICIDKIHDVANRTGATVVLDEQQDGSYIDCVLKKSDTSVYLIITCIGNEYYIYSLGTDFLPAEIYPDELSNKISLIDREDEICKNAEHILSEAIVFTHKPGLLNKKRGFIHLSIDGKDEVIWLKRNPF